MILVIAVFAACFLGSYATGIFVEWCVRDYMIWGRPRMFRQIALAELPNSVLVGAVVAGVILSWHYM